MLAKRLRRSDCSYFESFFRANPQGRQKAINLDKAQMNHLFPALIDAVNTERFPAKVDWFFSDRERISVHQNITLSEKNWRLNSMPWVDVDVEPDISIILCSILGDPDLGVPTGLAFALLNPGDQGYDRLDSVLPPGGFEKIDDDFLMESESWHPSSAVWQLIEHLTRGLPEIVDDVLGDSGASAASRLGLRSIDRTGSTQEAVRALNQFRTAIGLGGETLVDFLLNKSREFSSHEWVSLSNATASLDFRATRGAAVVAIEVKTTTSYHGRSFHISVSELTEARLAQEYEIWRVSKFAWSPPLIVGEVRRGDPSEIVAIALGWLATSPVGIEVPSLKISPESMSWTPPEKVECPQERVPSRTWMADIRLSG